MPLRDEGRHRLLNDWCLAYDDLGHIVNDAAGQKNWRGGNILQAGLLATAVPASIEVEPGVVEFITALASGTKS